MRLPASSALLAAVALFAGLAPAQQTYTVVDLGSLGLDTSKGYAINEAGEVTGYTLVPNGNSHAFLWRNGVMTDLGTLPSWTYCLGWGLNAKGVVVGESGSEAWRWDAASGMTALPGLGWFSYAHDVNDKGVIVGDGEDSSFRDRAFVWQNGTVTFLGGSTNTSGASAINERGEVAGYEAPSGSGVRATLWDPQGNSIDLNSPGSFSNANDLNELGQVVGLGNFPGVGPRQAFLWENGTMTSLGALAGASYPASEALGINNLGQVVGWSDNPWGSVPADHAFLWEGGVMHDLNDLIPPGTGWELVRAHGINDAGQICGYGVIQGNTRGFLLEPEARDLTLEGPLPGNAGAFNTLTARHATPGELVWFAYGVNPGQRAVTGCTGLTLGIRQARYLPPQVADPSGVATFGATVGTHLAGRTILFQVVEQASCRVSNVVTHTFL